MLRVIDGPKMVEQEGYSELNVYKTKVSIVGMEFDCHAPIEMTTLQFRIFVIRMEPNYLYLIIYC